VPARLTHGEPAREARSLGPSSQCRPGKRKRATGIEPGSATRLLTISSVNDSGGAPWPEPDSSTTSGLACRISSRPSSTTTSSCPCSGSANGSTQAPEDHSTTGLTVLKVRSCSSTKQRNREPTHEAKQVFITSHSWSRAERSSEKRTNGHVRARPSSWTNQASSLSMGNTVLRPTGSILTDLSSRRFATVPRRASRERRQARRQRESRAEAVLQEPRACLVALSLAERARVVARPHIERVPGHLRRLDGIDASAAGPRLHARIARC
jgi:hypothetical protein